MIVNVFCIPEAVFPPSQCLEYGGIASILIHKITKLQGPQSATFGWSFHSRTDRRMRGKTCVGNTDLTSRCAGTFAHPPGRDIFHLEEGTTIDRKSTRLNS